MHLVMTQQTQRGLTNVQPGLNDGYLGLDDLGLPQHHVPGHKAVQQVLQQLHQEPLLVPADTDMNVLWGGFSMLCP